MIQAILVVALIIWAQNKVIGIKTVYTSEPAVRDFENVDDAMEYAELRRTGWHGGVEDFYVWKKEL